MVRPKSSSKKPQKRGVDFKKYKRKIGRKLPPPKNTTDTKIESKAIVLPEQSVVSDRAGLALSNKGLTLKELLHQTSHHNAKVRRDALIGIRVLTSKHPVELTSHKDDIINKLRERFSDADRVVRETLYQFLQTVFFPACKQDISGQTISLIMAYIDNAMTHLMLDIRLTAFKFFELVVQHYPSSFLLYAEKVLQNYVDILLKSHSYLLQDKGKLKNALVGLVRCLSLCPSLDEKHNPSYQKDTDASGTLHAFECEVPREHTDLFSIGKKLEDLMPVLVNCFQELTSSVLTKPLIDSQSFECILCLLQSIDLALKYFIYWSSECQTDSDVIVSCMYKAPEVRVWGEAILLILLKKLLEVFPLSPVHNKAVKNDEKCYILNVAMAEIFLKFNEWIDSHIPMVKVLEFVQNALCGKVCCNTWSSKAVREKHLLSLVPYVPKLLLRADSSSKFRVLQAFTEAFKNCKSESSLKLTCLSAIEEMLLSSNRYDNHLLETSDPVILPFQIAWIHELPLLLVLLGDKYPSSSKTVLNLHLRLGQNVSMDSSLALEFDNTQDSLIEFYGTVQMENHHQGGIHYGPFILLPRDCQELAFCSLYYFSHLDSQLLKSLTYCCLYHSLDPSVILRIMEVLQSSYIAGHIQISDQISFFVTLLARFGAYPEKNGCGSENKKININHGTIKTITSAICSYLSQMGDSALVLHTVQKVILDEMSFKPPLDNMCAMLRVLAWLDSRPTLLSEQSIIYLSNPVLGYLVDSAYYIFENIHNSTDCNEIGTCKYYLVPCFILFDKSDKLLSLVLNLMGSLVAEKKTSFPSHDGNEYSFNQSNRIKAVASVLLLMHKDVKMQRILSFCKAEIRYILQELIPFQYSNDITMSLEVRHRIQVLFDELKAVIYKLHCWNADDFKKP